MYDVGVLPPYPLVDKLLQRPQYAQICGLPIVREGKVNFITVKFCNVFLVSVWLFTFLVNMAIKSARIVTLPLGRHATPAAEKGQYE